MKLSITAIALAVLAWIAFGPLTSRPEQHRSTAVVERGTPHGTASGADSGPAAAAIDQVATERATVRDGLGEHRAGPVTAVRIVTRGSRVPRPPVPQIAFTLAITGENGELLWQSDGRSDDSGKATVDVPRELIQASKRRRSNVYARVTEPGYQRRVGVAYVPRGSDLTTLDLRLAMNPGTSAEGRVVDENGEGVTADVSARRWAHPASGRRLEDAYAPIQEFAGGRFTVHLQTSMTVVLLADAGEHGTGALDPVALSLAAPAQDLLIEVSGPGVLRGRVLDRDGLPSKGVTLKIELASLQGVSRPLARSERDRLVASGRGHVESAVVTDEKGAFELRGLRPAEYVIQAVLPDGAIAPTRVLARAVAAPDSAELTLQFSAPRIAIHVIQAEGTAMAFPTLDLFGRDSEVPSEWGTAWTALVVDAGPLGSAPRPRGSARPYAKFGATGFGGTDPGGRADTVIIDVPDARQYLVSITGPGFDGRPLAVGVPMDAGQVDVTFHAQADLAMGELRVHVDSEGTRLAPENFKLTIEDPMTGMALLKSADLQRVNPDSFALPAGAYELTAEGIPRRVRVAGELKYMRVYGRAAARVNIRGDGLTEVTLDLGIGGKLSVEIKGELRPEDLKASADPRFERTYLTLHNTAPLSTSFAFIEFVTEAGRRETVLRKPTGVRPRVHLLTHHGGLSTFVGNAWPHGQTSESMTLPSGTFTLEGTLPGGRVVRVPVTITSGETTRAVLDFGS